MNDQLHVSADTPILSERELPCSVEAEQAVIGGLILDNSAWSRVSDLVRENDFYRDEHRLIFKAISKLADNGRAFDVVTLNDLLSTEGDLEGVGGHAYLSELFQNTPSVANISTYARIVSERASLRHIVGISDTIRKKALQPNGKAADELVHEAEQLILSVASNRPKTGGPVELNQLLSQAVSKIERLQETGGEAGGLSTSFHDLDKKLNFLRPADLIIVAGRPSMGKTTFAMNLVESAVLHSDKVVLVYSLEMPGEALTSRMLSSIGSIDHTRVRSGQLLDDDWSKLTRAANLINKRGEGRFFIDDAAGLSPSEMRFRTRRVQRAHGAIGLIMVDYLQLMQIPGSSGMNRTNEISEISRSLKALAKEFDCPVVALSQLNRSVEQRANKRPVNSDLRESGAIEQDADVILFAYRDEVYNPASKFQGTAEIIIGKQREGPVGFVRLGFVGRFTRFENLEPGTHDFTDEEMGVERIDPNPRLGRIGAQQLATAVKTKKEVARQPAGRRGPRRPP